ncbi:MAG: histidine kinase dimerization/phosphoacceptor domain -containing protein [Spirochaetales bacterium]
MASIFLLWGLHKLNYPLLSNNPQFVVWGYTLGSLLGVSAGIGLLLVFLTLEHRRAQESEARFRGLVNSLEDVCFTLDIEGRYTGVFGRWVEKVPNRASHFIGKTAIEILGGEEGKIHVEKAKEVVQSKKGVTYEWEISMPTGKQYYQTTLSSVFDQKANCVEIVGIGREITHLKLALEELQNRLEEKNSLIREIQHRVQNNFQFLISLLHLQMNSLENPESRKAFQIALSRLNTFAFIYNYLQERDNMNQVELQSYLVSLLTRILQFQISSAKPEVRIICDSMTLSSDQAMDMGFLCSELLDIVMEERRSVKVSKDIRFACHKESQTLCIYIDALSTEVPNWNSLDSKEAYHRLELVQSYIKQMKGSLHWDSSKIIVALPL